MTAMKRTAAEVAQAKEDALRRWAASVELEVTSDEIRDLRRGVVIAFLERDGQWTADEVCDTRFRSLSEVLHYLYRTQPDWRAADHRRLAAEVEAVKNDPRQVFGVPVVVDAAAPPDKLILLKTPPRPAIVGLPVRVAVAAEPGLEHVRVASDRELLRVLVERIGEGQPRRLPRWAFVHDRLRHGSGVSQAICRALALDPDEEVGGYPQEDDGEAE